MRGDDTVTILGSRLPPVPTSAACFPRGQAGFVDVHLLRVESCQCDLKRLRLKLVVLPTSRSLVPSLLQACFGDAPRSQPWATCGHFGQPCEFRLPLGLLYKKRTSIDTRLPAREASPATSADWGVASKASDVDLLSDFDHVINLDAEALRSCSNSFGCRR